MSWDLDIDDEPFNEPDNTHVKTGVTCGIISLITLVLVILIIVCMGTACTVNKPVKQLGHPRYEPVKRTHNY